MPLVSLFFALFGELPLYTTFVMASDFGHHIFTITTTIKATQSGVNIFENTYRWSGKGQKGNLRVVSPGHVLLGEVVGEGNWTYYYIHLGHPLNIGEEAEIKTVQELYDTEHEFVPFLAKIVSQPTDSLTLRVKLPRNALPSKILFSQWNAEGPAGKLINAVPGEANHQTGDIRWEIWKPVLGHKYEIRWDY